MRRFFQSLKSRLVLLIILVALPGLVGLIYLSILERENAINTALEQAINIVEITTYEQTKLIEETHVFLKHLSSLKSILTPESPACSLTLANILMLNTNYVNLGVPQANGDLFCNAKPLDKPINVADRPYIQQALATRDFSIGEFQVDRAAGVTSINFAYPVINPITDKTEGLAVAVVSLDWWSNRLSESRLPEKTVAYITDHKQKIIAVYPTNSKLLGSNINTVLADLLRKNSSSGLTTKPLMSADNQLRMFVSKPLFNTGDLVNISVGVPLGDELRDINSRLVKTGIFILLFIILMFVIAMKGIQKSILSPLNVLLQSTKSLELGNNIADIPQHGSSEFINLQKNFSLMAKTRLNAERLLRKSENRLARHIENTPLGCISWDRNLICTEWNKSAENIFGYRADEAIGRKATELIIAPELYDEIDVIYGLLLEQKGGGYSTNENVSKDGSILICEWHNTPIIENDGSVTGVASLVQDITKRKQLEDKLTQAASVFSHAHEGIMITDASGIITEVNETFIAITGYKYDEVIGKNPSILGSNRHSPLFYKQLWESLAENGYWSGEIWNKRKNHEIYPERLTISTVHCDDGKVKNYVAVFTDITEIKKHQSQLEHMAHYDSLTSLPNRTLLAERLNQAIIQSKRNKKTLAVAFLDLDGFKDINDAHGHTVGDELLVLLSQRLKETLRDCDTLSRFGGDEFVAILADLENVQDFKPVVERMLIAASKPIIVTDTLLKVSASIGITLYPMDNVDTDQLIRHADQAMYISKQQGKNCYRLFDIESEDAHKKYRGSIQDIAHAITNHEFVLYYQPKVNMKTGGVIGAEALIRWQHPKRGLLSPVDFLPLIENHNLSIKVGEWVINESLTQIAKWQEIGLNLEVSVNIGALQLQEQNFAERLAILLAAHAGVDPSYLQLEVLETSALGDVINASQVMRKCAKLGVTFAIDDFGTGYSSLTYLRRLPANLIKIDQTFVCDMLVDPEDKAIVVGVIALATSFNREVIAEGVETIEHGTALLGVGCELAQGYGIAKPMPADEIPEWATNWQPNISWQLV